MVDRFERQAARRYAHMCIPYRRCEVGFCAGCWWRSLTGQHSRAKAAMIAKGKERLAKVRECGEGHGHDWWPVPIGGTDRFECSMCHGIRWTVRRNA